MKLINSILIFLFIMFSSCNKNAEKDIDKSEKQKMLVDKKTVYEFLNYNFSSKNPIFKNCEYVLNCDPLPYFDEHDSIALIKMDTIFSKADIEFIFRQSNYSKQFIIEKEFFKGKKIVELNMKKAFSDTIAIRKKYWAEISDNYFPCCITNVPLFSLDKQTALIKIGYQSEWGIFVYRKVDGKWIWVATLSRAIA